MKRWKKWFMKEKGCLQERSATRLTIWTGICMSKNVEGELHSVEYDDEFDEED